MPCLPFDAMPDTARLWIFPATRPLAAAEGERVLAEPTLSSPDGRRTVYR